MNIWLLVKWHFCPFLAALFWWQWTWWGTVVWGLRPFFSISDNVTPPWAAQKVLCLLTRKIFGNWVICVLADEETQEGHICTVSGRWPLTIPPEPLWSEATFVFWKVIISLLNYLFKINSLYSPPQKPTNGCMYWMRSASRVTWVSNSCVPSVFESQLKLSDLARENCPQL